MGDSDGHTRKLSDWDHTSHERFFDYYAMASQSQETLQRFHSARDRVLRLIQSDELASRPLEVADIGCGAGTQCMLWAESGHRVHGVDVNEPLLDLARDRAASAGHSIDFRVGSAVALPWPNESMDVCLVLELLEHVAEWQTCLDECARILRPGGIMVLATSNRLCPIQHEFDLPLYSWYPAPCKRYFEHLALTTHPELANFAKYPAVNWFSFYSLRAALTARGFYCMDKFDVIDLSTKSLLAGLIVSSIRLLPFLRLLAHLATPGTMVMARKRSNALAGQ